MVKYFVISIILFIFTMNYGFGNNKPISSKHNKTNRYYIVNNYEKHYMFYGFKLKPLMIDILIIESIYGNILFYPIIEK
jgi:hypothetical protein